MKQYRQRIKNKTLTSEDIDNIVLKIQQIIKEKQKGHIDLSDGDLKQLRILKYLLKKYENEEETVLFSTAEEQLNSHKVKKIIKELELNQIISDSTKYIGGGYEFEIIENTRYRDYIYKLVEDIINKIPHDTVLCSLKRIDWQNPYIVGIVCTIIGAILIYIFVIPISPQLSTIFWKNEEAIQLPRVEIESVHFSTNKFSCNYIRYPSFYVSYKIAHIDGKDVGFGQPFYQFINQTKNTCLDNFTFFNRTTQYHALCHNVYEYESGKKESCYAKIDPISEEVARATSYLNADFDHMLNIFRSKNVSDCDISEQVRICVELDSIMYCSQTKTFNLEYSACKK